MFIETLARRPMSTPISIVVLQLNTLSFSSLNAFSRRWSCSLESWAECSPTANHRCSETMRSVNSDHSPCLRTAETGAASSQWSISSAATGLPASSRVRPKTARGSGIRTEAHRVSIRLKPPSGGWNGVCPRSVVLRAVRVTGHLQTCSVGARAPLSSRSNRHPTWVRASPARTTRQDWSSTSLIMSHVSAAFGDSSNARTRSRASLGTCPPRQRGQRRRCRPASSSGPTMSRVRISVPIQRKNSRGIWSALLLRTTKSSVSRTKSFHSSSVPPRVRHALGAEVSDSERVGYSSRSSPSVSSELRLLGRRAISRVTSSCASWWRLSWNGP